MQLPDLQETVALWQRAYRVTDWIITSEYVDNLVHPETGQPVWGLCTITNADNRTAHLRICTPRNAKELAEVVDTIIHEMTHVLLVGAQIPVTREEEKIAWTLAPLLCHFQANAPDLLADYVRSLPWGSPSLARVVARDVAQPKKAVLAARVRARVVTENTRGKSMDQRALLTKLLEMVDLPQEAKDLITAALGEGEASAEEAPVAGEAMGADKPNEEPPMAAEKPDDAYMKAKAKADAEAQSAAVKALVEHLPLAAEQKTYAAKLRSVADVQEYLASLPKAPTQEIKARQMGMSSAVRGGEPKKTHFQKARTVSPDSALNQMMRIVPSEPDGNYGIQVPDDKSNGKLVIFSISDALPDIKKSVAENARGKVGT